VVRAKVDTHGLIDKSTPPLFLFTSQRDAASKKANDRGGYVHSPRHSEAIAAKAKETGVPHELVIGDDAAGKDGNIEAIAFFKKQFDQIKSTATAPEAKGKKAAKASGQFTPSVTPLYKTIDDAKLKLHVFNPADHKTSDRRPAVVFFFGGGFRSGAPTQFYPHSAYLASRGLVAISAEYRIKNTYSTNPEQSVSDAKSAIRWVRAHAAELGVDPTRIAAGGGSAGGFLAAATATLSGYDKAGEDTSVSPRPDALVIYNGLFDLGAGEYGSKEEISPLKNIRAPFPPTAFFVGSQDKLLPVSDVGRIKDAVIAAGGRFDLHVYDGQSHGFFNYGKNEGEYYKITLQETDRFLTSLGWLAGEPSPPN
jgi:acetyl esterase/lipase